MRRFGLTESEVRRSVERHLRMDVPWSRVLNSICTQPDAFGAEMASIASHTNLGDVRIFRGTHRLEQQAVARICDLLGNPGGPGSLVSGGTEANLLAMYVAKKLASARRGTTRLAPEVIVGETVHYSFNKVFQMLGLIPAVAPVDDSLRMDPSKVTSLITPGTVAIVGTAGSSEFGSVDPVEQLSEIAAEHGVYLHVDAATGGFIIPFARELGYDLPRFDFTLPGVSSITMDPHKYGLVGIPAGGIFFRDESLQAEIGLDSFFAATPTHRTFLGTRPGAGAVATYAVLEHLGWEGFVRVTRTNFENTEYLMRELRSRGYALAVRPDLNIVVVSLPAAAKVMEVLESWDWIVSVSKRFRDTLRIVVTGHVTRSVIDAFLDALDRAVRDVREAA